MQQKFAEIREAESGALEQELLRIEDLRARLDKIATETLEQAKADAKKNSTSLAKAWQSRHQDVVRELTEIRSDLREENSARLNQVSGTLEKTGQQLQKVVADLDSWRLEGSRVSEQVNETFAEPSQPVATSAPREETPPAPRKKQFWSKLNVFKKKTKPASPASAGGE